MTIKTFIKKATFRILWEIIVTGREKLNPLLGKYRKKNLLGTDFTILSNNCWGGHVYRRYLIGYNTPTVGLFIWPESFIKLASNYKYYLEQPLKFIDWKDSDHADRLESINLTYCPIGKLDDVEIVFMHYHSEEEAYEKWNRRLQRVNYDHVLIKCSKQNGMTDEQVAEFDAIPHKDKIIFVNKPMPQYKSAVWYRFRSNAKEVPDDVLFFRKYFNLEEWINNSYKSK